MTKKVIDEYLTKFTQPLMSSQKDALSHSHLSENYFYYMLW